MNKPRLTATALVGGMAVLAGGALAHDGGANDAGTPVCLEANYMVANAQFTPFAEANGPGEVIEQNIITGERGITVINPFAPGVEVCDAVLQECPGPWKPTGTFSGGQKGHAYITSAGQQALTEFHRDGSPIRTVSYKTITGNPLGRAGRGSLPRPLGTQIMPNGNLVQAICDANFFNAGNSDPIAPGESDPDPLTTNPAIPGLAANQFFPPVFATPERNANSRILVIDQDTLEVIDEYSQPKKNTLGHDLWGCVAGISFTDEGMFLSTFHGGAVLVVDWREGVSGTSRGVGANNPGNFSIDRESNRARVTRVIDYVGGSADNPHRRDTLRANTLDEQGNLYATNRRRHDACERGDFGIGSSCNPGTFRQRVSIDIVADDDGPTDEDATLALDPGINIIAGIRINRMSARGCDYVQAEAIVNGVDPASREFVEQCNVETLLVAGSAMNPGCDPDDDGSNGPGHPANQCFTPGGYVAEYRIDEAHLDGASGSCTGDPADGFGAGEGNEGCAQPIATFGGAVNGDVNIDPRMLMPIQRAFIQ